MSRKVTAPKPVANPMLCPSSATVSADMPIVQAMKLGRGPRMHRPSSRPVPTAATITPAIAIRTEIDIDAYGARLGGMARPPAAHLAVARPVPGSGQAHARATGAAAGLPPRRLLLVTPLDAGLLQQLAVLLLGHPLTTLLDD